MALTLIERIRWLIGDVDTNRFYPLLSDEQIEDALDLFGNNVILAAQVLAGSAVRILSQKNTKEVYGDVEVWNEDRKQYLESLKLFADNPSLTIPVDIIPYAAGISVTDFEASKADVDNPRNSSFLYNSDRGCECDGSDLTITV